MKIKDNVFEDCHMLWLKLKQFHILMNYMGNVVDFSNNDETNLEIWDILTTRVEDIFSTLSGNVIIKILHNIACENEVWNNYELLIDNLAKLLLLKDYNIVSDCDDFIYSIIDLLSYFENELKAILLNKQNNT